MGRDSITVTATARAGVLPTLNTPDATNDAQVANAAGRTVVAFVNGMGGASAQATLVTIQQVADPYGRIQNEAAFNVPVNVVGVFGPFPPLLYNQTNGTVQIDYDAVSANARVFALIVQGA